MRKCIPFILCFCLCGQMIACSPKTQEEERTPVEDVVISTPPVYEVPQPPKQKVDDDGVWLADDELLYGVPQPVQRQILNCDKYRQCNFVVSMDYAQVRAFLDKYFPYQKYAYHKAVNLFEVLPELKDEFKAGGIVPSLDPKIKRPEPGNAVRIAIAWTPKYNAYVWYYTSAFALREEEAAQKEEQRAHQKQIEDVVERVLQKGSYQGLSEEDTNVLSLLDFVVMHEGALTQEDIDILKSLRQAPETKDTTESGIVPTLKPVDALPIPKAPSDAPSEADVPVSEPDTASNSQAPTPDTRPKKINLLPAITQTDAH